VQGVGFRWWTRSHALRLGVTGTVRNCTDGSVEVHLRGPGDAIAKMKQYLRSGPPGARVEAIEEIEVAGPLPSDGFTILR
jgi:acylphosphatase